VPYAKTARVHLNEDGGFATLQTSAYGMAVGCINEAFANLSDYAGIHPMRYGHHRMGVPHFPFSVYYDIEGEDAVVKAVLDDRFGPARIAAHFGPQH